MSEGRRELVERGHDTVVEQYLVGFDVFYAGVTPLQVFARGGLTG